MGLSAKYMQFYYDSKATTVSGRNLSHHSYISSSDTTKKMHHQRLLWHLCRKTNLQAWCILNYYKTLVCLVALSFHFPVLLKRTERQHGNSEVNLLNGGNWQVKSNCQSFAHHSRLHGPLHSCSITALYIYKFNLLLIWHVLHSSCWWPTLWWQRGHVVLNMHATETKNTAKMGY
jgi:hypothetical protein